MKKEQEIENFQFFVSVDEIKKQKYIIKLVVNFRIIFMTNVLGQVKVLV